jgi:hypothetical protein
MSYNNVGQVWTSDSFDAYLKTLQRPSWCTKVCLHHTSSPSLAQRPSGFTVQHIINMRDYYKSLGWSSGPHLFIDEDQVWGMTPLNERGVHAVSFNSTAIGIEVLGDYDSENNATGRGLQCWQMAAKVTKSLFTWLNVPINASNLLFHRDDPQTSKTCPGTKVTKDWVLSLINAETPAPNECKCPTCGSTVASNSMQPVIKYVTTYKGYSDSEAYALLKRGSDGFYYFGNDWLEGAKYDATQEATIAPLSELQQIVKKS